jgi:alkylated DNA repair dioxygenase AlkB
MNPPNPPPVGTDPVVAAQMHMLQQMANTMADMLAYMRQERQEMRQERQDMWEEMRQERMGRQQQAPLPPPPPPLPPRDKHRKFMSTSRLPSPALQILCTPTTS